MPMKSPESGLPSNFRGFIGHCTRPLGQTASAIRLRSDAQVGAYRLVAFGELLLDDFFILQAGYDNDVVALLPVHRRRNTVTIGQLQGVDDPQNFIEISARARRVSQNHA